MSALAALVQAFMALILGTIMFVAAVAVLVFLVEVTTDFLRWLFTKKDGR